MKWLSIVLVSLSCFAFSLSPVPVNAGQTLPIQIEQVVSEQGDNNRDSESFQKVVSKASSLYSANRSRGHEKNVQLNYQKEIKVLFESISKNVYSFLLPNRSLPLKIISDNSDEGFPPLSLA